MAMTSRECYWVLLGFCERKRRCCNRRLPGFLFAKSFDGDGFLLLLLLLLLLLFFLRARFRDGVEMKPRSSKNKRPTEGRRPRHFPLQIRANQRPHRGKSINKNANKSHRWSHNECKWRANHRRASSSWRSRRGTRYIGCQLPGYYYFFVRLSAVRLSASASCRGQTKVYRVYWVLPGSCWSFLFLFF